MRSPYAAVRQRLSGTPMRLNERDALADALLIMGHHLWQASGQQPYSNAEQFVIGQVAGMVGPNSPAVSYLTSLFAKAT